MINILKVTLWLALGAAVVLASGCHSGISRSGYTAPTNAPTALTNSIGRPIAIQDNVKYDTNEVIVLGSIHAYDTGFSTDCDEAYVLTIMYNDARAVGADLINITEEEQPGFVSTCYRARAQFLRFKDREKAKDLVSDPKYAPERIIERTEKSSRRTNAIITGAVMGGALGAIITWQATAPHEH